MCKNESGKENEYDLSEKNMLVKANRKRRRCFKTSERKEHSKN